MRSTTDIFIWERSPFSILLLCRSRGCVSGLLIGSCFLCTLMWRPKVKWKWIKALVLFVLGYKAMCNVRIRIMEVLIRSAVFDT